MRRITTRFIVSYLAVALTLAVVAPALGAVDLVAIRKQIADTVREADQANQQTLNQFSILAVAASTPAELIAERNHAHADLDATWDLSISKLDAYLALAPAELGNDVAAAKNQLLIDHNAAHAEVDDLAAYIMDTKFSTTTTQPPVTTTTTTTTTQPATTTTTTRPPDTTTTTRPPATSTTTRPSDTTTTTRPSDTTTTTVVGSGTGGPGSGGPGSVDVPGTGGGTAAPSSSDAVGDAIAGFDAAALSSPVFAAATPEDQEHVDEMIESNMHGMVSMMLSAGASVVLPDRVAQVAVAPIVLVEMLIGTLFESLRDLIVPLVMLAMAVAIFVWRETRRGGLGAR